MTENKDMYAVFYEEIENEQKKDKKNLTYRSRDSNPRFSVIFLAMIWIFMVGEGDEIKSKQTSKRDRTLLKVSKFAYVIYEWSLRQVSVEFNAEDTDENEADTKASSNVDIGAIITGMHSVPESLYSFRFRF